MLVYITKYCLTKGILEKEVKVSSASDDMVVTTNSKSSFEAFHKPYWYENKEDAIKHANLMRTRKIASLQKSILKLEKLSF